MPLLFVFAFLFVRALSAVNLKETNKFDRWECVDLYENCPGWANEGLCKSVESVRLGCRMSCRDHVCEGSDCKDDVGTFCVDLARQGRCSKDVSVARKCQKSCNPWCKGPTPTTLPPTTMPPPTTTPPGPSHPCLQVANSYRARHRDTPPLHWDETLVTRAQNYANKLMNMAIRQGSVSLIHDPDNFRLKMGENLYYWPFKGRQSDSFYCTKSNKLWYDEIKNWDFRSSTGNLGMCGHFTQLVWKSTSRVGFGIAVAELRYTKGYQTAIVVAKFQPPGNWYQKARENVMPLK